jgi:uncharacterized protein YjiS (DUF1127 family)
MESNSTWLVHVSPVPREASPTSRQQNWWTRPFRLLRLSIAAIATRRRNRRAAAELLTFEDHLLRDIGLSRSEIEGATLFKQVPVRSDEPCIPVVKARE